MKLLIKLFVPLFTLSIDSSIMQFRLPSIMLVFYIEILCYKFYVINFYQTEKKKSFSEIIIELCDCLLIYIFLV